MLLFLILFFNSFSILAQTSNVESEKSPWSLGFGVGPNLSQIDAVSDELGSSLGAAIWMTRSIQERQRLDLSLDYFGFKESGQNYFGLSGAYGLNFFKGEPYQFFGVLGLGVGQANEFPRTVNRHQNPLHGFGRVGMDRLLQFGNWNFGLVVDAFYVDLDDKPATSAQLGLPLLTLTYQFKNEKKVEVAKNETPVDSDSDKDGVLNLSDECPNTPIGQSVNSIGCPVQIAVKKELRVEFATNKSTIKPSFEVVVQEFAKFMKDHKDLKVTIEGHTDNVGSQKYNIGLSQRRANAVKDRLVELGVDPNSLKAIGYGPTRPETDNSTPQLRLKNRRVLAVIETK